MKIIISAGLLLKVNHLITIGQLNNAILPDDKKITKDNQLALLQGFQALDQNFNGGKLNPEQFTEKFHALLCNVLDIDSADFELPLEQFKTAWNAMLGNDFETIQGIVSQLQEKYQEVILISGTNLWHHDCILEKAPALKNVTYATTYQSQQSKAELYKTVIQANSDATVVVGNTDGVTLETVKQWADADQNEIAAAAGDNLKILNPKEDILGQLEGLGLVQDKRVVPT